MYCSHEDKKLKDLEKLEQRLEGVVLNHVEKHKTRAKNLAKNCEKLEECVKNKDKEIDELNLKINELKNQREKERII